MRMRLRALRGGGAAAVSDAVECRYHGRDFTVAEMRLLRGLTATEPTRAAIARAFCRRTGWHKPDGGLKSMMAKVVRHECPLSIARSPRSSPRNGSWCRRVSAKGTAKRAKRQHVTAQPNAYEVAMHCNIEIIL